MTLEDNLKYIKHDILNGNHALMLFEEIKDTFKGPEIPSAMI